MRNELEKGSAYLDQDRESATLRVASEAELENVMVRARARLRLAGNEVLARLRTFNPQIFQSIHAGNRLLGLAAWLPLNELGLGALLSGHLDASDPHLSYLCAPGVQPVAAYCWYVHAPRRLVRALPAILNELSQLAPGAPVYTRPVHAHAVGLLVKLGFVSVQSGATGPGSLYWIAGTLESGNDPSTAPAKPVISCRLAYTVEDMMKVFTVRAATYMHEQYCPYAEEFDGNDFCAAHFLGLIGEEPAGCIRVRFFAGFVKIERLAVRHEFRRSRLAFQLVKHAIAFARRKGYQTAYGHCAADLIKFWGRFGFKPIPHRAPFAFSGVLYHEMIAELDAEPSRIAIGEDPYILVRPENLWDVPGPLDRSKSRDAVISPRGHAG